MARNSSQPLDPKDRNSPLERIGGLGVQAMDGVYDDGYTNAPRSKATQHAWLWVVRVDNVGLDVAKERAEFAPCSCIAGNVHVSAERWHRNVGEPASLDGIDVVAWGRGRDDLKASLLERCELRAEKPVEADRGGRQVQ